ncbi:formylglycine-generating enzyme family protein [Massilia sp. MB5]|uniref:formylglycine-generating enzyme family protein n=1 Tax=Massilia sp. MB5 TaxID=2919578 RepID=UPI001F0E6E1D|nr:formylglycine-generating enzyme family protein [Massilia sp. MB5]UMR30017.1 formylglycine-generating enzyme family protein [Massilia sp. MB5]
MATPRGSLLRGLGSAAVLLVQLLAPAGAVAAAADDGALSATPAASYRKVPGGSLRSVLPADGVDAPATVAPFLLRTNPVSVEEFRNFLASHPEWQRGQIPGLFAAPGYLAAWQGDMDSNPLQANSPVTQVSWYAARAFCEAEGGRLPRWYEWEFAAAASATRADAREDDEWLLKILSWYERPGNVRPGAIGMDEANLYGIHNLHGLIWEWVDDFSGLFVNADSRAKGEQKTMEFCGGAAVSLADRRNYAILMRLTCWPRWRASSTARTWASAARATCSRKPPTHSKA